MRCATTEELLAENARLRDEVDQLTYGMGDYGDGTYLPDHSQRQLTLTQENDYFKATKDWEVSPLKTLGDLLAPRFKPIDLAMATDAQVELSLRVLVDELQRVGQNVVCADHLSDRRLYCILVKNVLSVLVKDLRRRTPCLWYCCFHSESGILSPDDVSLYLKYYASDEERAIWKRRHPESSLPPKETAPHPRSFLAPGAPLLTV